MVKECKVLLNNEAVTVIKYDNTEIQFPAIRKNAKTVFVVCEDGKYSIVEKDYKQKSAEKSNKKRSTEKKTTIEESAIENEKDV